MSEPSGVATLRYSRVGTGLLGYWRSSLQFRLGAAVSAITVLAVLAVLAAVRTTGTTTGEAGALNTAGSLRMLLWQIRAESAAAGALQGFDQRLVRLGDQLETLAAPGRAVTRAYFEARRNWRDLVRPLLEREHDASQARDARLTSFLQDLDGLTALIEQDLESKIRWLALVQALLLAIILSVAGVALLMLQHQLMEPLQGLLRVARAVRSGRFDVSVPNPGWDELGQLGATFNSMVENLGHLYNRLETLVGERTRELNQRHHSLQLLYRATTRLSVPHLTQEVLLELLGDVEQALGLGKGLICVRQDDALRAYPLATHLAEADRTALCERLGCSLCFGAGADLPQGVTLHRLSELQLVTVPLASAGHWQGVMPFQLLPGTELEPWQAQVLETLGHHVATALANSRRSEEQRRLAVLEERSVIARELHDSLAQTLSYLKIQISLLQTRSSAPPDSELARSIDVVQLGLGSAYRELRELLTTFRISPGATPFNQELARMVTELSARAGFPIVLEQHMDSLELSANEEIHLTRIVREALLNVIQHANAHWARVQLWADSLRRVTLFVEDNGIGISSQPERLHHYGLALMRERAALLEGQLRWEPRPEGGTRVRLDFVADTPYVLQRQVS